LLLLLLLLLVLQLCLLVSECAGRVAAATAATTATANERRSRPKESARAAETATPATAAEAAAPTAHPETATAMTFEGDRCRHRAWADCLAGANARPIVVNQGHAKNAVFAHGRRQQADDFIGGRQVRREAENDAVFAEFHDLVAAPIYL